MVEKKSFFNKAVQSSAPAAGADGYTDVSPNMGLGGITPKQKLAILA
jgi:hypothetical protein